METETQRILIVDDDAMVAETLTLIFRKNGFDVRSSNSAAEALQVAHIFRPDLLVCDILMPDRDGLDLVADVTRDLPSCRILVLTGFYADLGAVERHSRTLPRPVSILTKPCQPTDLLRQANALLALA